MEYLGEYRTPHGERRWAVGNAANRIGIFSFTSPWVAQDFLDNRGAGRYGIAL